MISIRRGGDKKIPFIIALVWYKIPVHIRLASRVVLAAAFFVPADCCQKLLKGVEKMLKNSFRTCISCDDPIEHEGFSLNVCENCSDDSAGSDQGRRNIAARLKDSHGPADTEALAAD